MEAAVRRAELDRWSLLHSPVVCECEISAVHVFLRQRRQRESEAGAERKRCTNSTWSAAREREKRRRSAQQDAELPLAALRSSPPRSPPPLDLRPSCSLSLEPATLLGRWEAR
ncbi:uncharacterized protein LOC124661020 isoform X2 [Lolium rigidum]|uniref:uncharacterized protein LOC124661020 isoform X2 n=1 Tax=Lolium rigidum TaxID=89674 RepID=UPI001F5C50A1|nr:uncharacterized protein LOC124661020 isoform X2 [Lolium rigidum]